MKILNVGDKVKFIYVRKQKLSSKLEDEIGIIVEVDNSHRQQFAKILTKYGILRIWEKHIEVIHEND